MNINQLDEDTRRQLFDAICSEVIGEDEQLEDKPPLNHGNGYIYSRNELRAELRQRLRVFFGQDGEKGDI